MTKSQAVAIPYAPRPLQMEIHKALYNNGNRIRFACFAIHRRFGKSVLAINELIAAALTCPHPNPRCHYIAPTFKQAKAIAWDYLKEFTKPIRGMRYMETELSATFPNGAKITLVGAENYEAIRGQYSDACVLDEWGNMSVNVWKEVLRPALSDRLGWCIFLGTPNGKNHFYQTYKEAENDPHWIARTYRADETKLIPDEELDMARRTMGEEEYRQEFLCDWTASMRGSFYSLEMSRAREEGRITVVPHTSLLPVYLAFDLGIDDYTAIWFAQLHRKEVRLIEYMDFSDMGLLNILDEVERTRRHYSIKELWLPHDIAVRELMSGKSRLEALQERGYHCIVAKCGRVEDGIQAVRGLLSQCFFDENKTFKGIDCLESYRKKLDPRTNTYLTSPVHDEFSHGADAFRTLAAIYDEELGVEDRSFNYKHGYVRNNGRPKVIRSC